MEALAIFVIMVLAAVGGAWAMFEYRTFTQPDRERALRAELDALQAAQRLSIAAWQARQHMSDLVHGNSVDAP